MVLVNAATGQPITSTGVNSLGGTMTTQSINSGLPAGISVQQLLQQAQQQQQQQQQQAAQAQQVQQQVRSTLLKSSSKILQNLIKSWLI